jgi:hypothetical protein
MIKGVVNSKKLQQIKYRIKMLPQYMDQYIDAKRKRDCKEIIDEFKDGIKNNKLGLEPLKQTTINSKASQGFPKPKVPLYGAGEMKKDRAFYNMLQIKRLKRGWKVTPSNKMHWSGKIKLSDLLDIHEKGCIIKNGFGKGALIRIPPRPALNRAYSRWAYKYRSKQPDKEIKKAVSTYIKSGKDLLLNNVVKRLAVKVENDS